MSLPLPDDHQSLPPVLVGPLLRRLEPTRLVMWLVGSRALSLTLRLQDRDDIRLDARQCTVIAVGTHAFVHLIDVPLDAALPCDTLIEYDLLIDDAGTGIADWAPHLLYGDARCPNFVLRYTGRSTVARFLPQTSPSGPGRFAVRRSFAGGRAGRTQTSGAVDDERRSGVRRRCRGADVAGHPCLDRAAGAVRRAPRRRGGQRQRQTLRAPRQLLPSCGFVTGAAEQRNPARAIFRWRA